MPDDETDLRGVESWPIVRAWAPRPNVWKSTGFGTAGIVREQPDGRLSSAFFILNLYDGGLDKMMGKGDETAEEVDEFLRTMKGLIPPMMEAPVGTASAFMWGAYAYSAGQGILWPPDSERFFVLMPKPPGGLRLWLKRLTGSGGPTHPGLLKVLRENPIPEGLPEGKEIAIITNVGFAIEHPERALEKLEQTAPEFQFVERDDEDFYFDWTRPDPRGEGRILGFLRGRQVIGTVIVAPDALLASAYTLSMAARLIETLEDLLDEPLTLAEVSWTAQA